MLSHLKQDEGEGGDNSTFPLENRSFLGKTVMMLSSL